MRTRALRRLRIGMPGLLLRRQLPLVCLRICRNALRHHVVCVFYSWRNFLMRRRGAVWLGNCQEFTSHCVVARCCLNQFANILRMHAASMYVCNCNTSPSRPIMRTPVCVLGMSSSPGVATECIGFGHLRIPMRGQRRVSECLQYVEVMSPPFCLQLFGNPSYPCIVVQFG